MPTYRQLALYGRKQKRRRSLVAALFGSPHKKAVVVKLAITTPRKPNSAKRKYAKIRIAQYMYKVVHAHIPGRGNPHIQEYSVVMVEGGSPPDTPGVNYSLIRGLYDFDHNEEFGRQQRRSKFGKRKPFYKQVEPRLSNVNKQAV